MLAGALRRRKRWRSGLLKTASAAHSEVPVEECSMDDDPLPGFRRAWAATDFAQADLEELLKDNKWIKRGQAGHVSDFLAHSSDSSYFSDFQTDFSDLPSVSSSQTPTESQSLES